jgi:hypothetical protein
MSPFPRFVDHGLPSPRLDSYLQSLVLGTCAGSRWTFPEEQVAYGGLVEATAGSTPNDRLYPLHQRTSDHDIRRAAERAGFGIRSSGHYLLRYFGRIGYQAGVSLADRKSL